MKGIYIHIPFCKRKCNYCDFCSYPQHTGRKSEYIDALLKEADTYRGDNICADTIYFGGGTPSLLDTLSLSRITEGIRDAFDVSPDAEITLEANPCTVTEQMAKELFSLGFNRISLGAQSFSDDELKKLGRTHNAYRTEKSFCFLREAGFRNISLDLMYAIPGQSMQSLEESIAKTIELKPEHISCYGLKIEEGTAFGKMLSSGIITEKPQDEYADMYDMICARLKAQGYEQYELSNFSLPSFESKHNLKYWKAGQYVGLGASAASYYNDVRYTNTSDFDRYLCSFEKTEQTELDIKDKMSEYMFLTLRLTQIGASKREFEKLFSLQIKDVFRIPIEKHIANGTIIDKGDRYVLAPKAYYVSNYVLCDFV